MNILILCGGKSTRMNGLDKANLPYQDQTFLSRIAGKFQECQNKYISNNKTITHHYPGYQEIIDEYDEIGPISGITSFFHQTNHNDVFVVACDMPYINKEVLDKLYSLYKGEDAIYLYDEQHDYPLAAIYSRNILPILHKQIENKRYSLIRCLELSNARKIHRKELSIDAIQLSNINTLKDYKEL